MLLQEGKGGQDSMSSAAVPLQTIPAPEPHPCTLLELVRVLSEITDNEHEVVATAIHMICTGSVRLIGNFRDAPVEDWV
jgi:hypothetical protein